MLGFIVYHELVKTTQLYIRDVTQLPPMALLLFGGALKEVGQPYQNGALGREVVLSVGGSWVRFSVPVQLSEALYGVRAQLDQLLRKRTEQGVLRHHPSGLSSQSQESQDVQLLRAVSRLVSVPPEGCEQEEAQHPQGGDDSSTPKDSPKAAVGAEEQGRHAGAEGQSQAFAATGSWFDNISPPNFGSELAEPQEAAGVLPQAPALTGSWIDDSAQPSYMSEWAEPQEAVGVPPQALASTGSWIDDSAQPGCRSEWAEPQEAAGVPPQAPAPTGSWFDDISPPNYISEPAEQALASTGSWYNNASQPNHGSEWAEQAQTSAGSWYDNASQPSQPNHGGVWAEQQGGAEHQPQAPACTGSWFDNIHPPDYSGEWAERREGIEGPAPTADMCSDGFSGMADPAVQPQGQAFAGWTCPQGAPSGWGAEGPASNADMCVDGGFMGAAGPAVHQQGQSFADWQCQQDVPFQPDAGVPQLASTFTGSWVEYASVQT